MINNNLLFLENHNLIQNNPYENYENNIKYKITFVSDLILNLS